MSTNNRDLAKKIAEEIFVEKDKRNWVAKRREEREEQKRLSDDIMASYHSLGFWNGLLTLLKDETISFFKIVVVCLILFWLVSLLN